MDAVVQIDNYLEKLRNQLEMYGIFSNQKVLDNIKLQIYSVIELWNDKETRNGILLFSMELAWFYQPDANLNHKAFVATAIRNSMLETVGSDFYAEAGFERRLKDEEMRQITSYAISYFKKFSFEEACLEIQKLEFSNCYLDSIKKYSLAWEVVKKMANLKKMDTYFEPIAVCEDKKMLIYPTNLLVKENERDVIEDGMSLSFNKTLFRMLNDAISHPEIGFFTDSFKYLSRNFEKVLKTMQYLLERNSRFVTFNYYFSNGYISQRKNLLKPSHGAKELDTKLKETKQISSKHKQALELLKKLNSTLV